MHGYTGKSLFIDLSTGKHRIVKTPAPLIEKFIGGRGLGVALIAPYIRYPWDSHEMPLIFSSGPLVGTASPTSGRISIVSRSPLTGTVFDCSVGGRFGTEMKKAGYDLIFIQGKARGWKIIEVTNDDVKIMDAEKLSGKNTEELLKTMGNTYAIATIGRAGEKGVRFAGIVFDGHYLAGRGGLGAVMGAKRLKAIMIQGDNGISVYDETELRRAREEIMRLLRASPSVFGEFGLSEFGTAALVDLIHVRRMEPTENFKRSYFEHSHNYSGYSLKTLFNPRKTGCKGCPIFCKKISTGGKVIPEFETVSHFGALNKNSEPETIIEANRLCNDYGLDTISTASTIACYSEINDRWLTPEELLQYISLIGERKDIGEHLSEGSLRYATAQGMPQFSMSVKGLELPAYDPRGAYGIALAYATSNRGGCHLRAYPISYEILRKPVSVDRFSFEGKARMVKISEDMNAVVDSLTACKFVFFASTLEEYAPCLKAVTGRDFDVQSLLKAGERIWLLERYLNNIIGFSRKDDDLPERFFKEPGYSEGKFIIPPINREDFLYALNRYYRIRGYKEDGTVNEEILDSANLKGLPSSDHCSFPQ